MASAASTATMKVAVAVKMPKRELAKKNNSSGPRSSASLRYRLGCRGLAVICGVVCSATRRRTQSGIQPDQGAAEIVRRERCQIVNAFAQADEMHRHFELLGDG